MTTCRKCGGPMRPGKAMVNPMVAGERDFPGVVTLSPGKAAVLAPVLKCADCGHSFEGGRDDG